MSRLLVIKFALQYFQSFFATCLDPSLTAKFIQDDVPKRSQQLRSKCGNALAHSEVQLGFLVVDLHNGIACVNGRSDRFDGQGRIWHWCLVSGAVVDSVAQRGKAGWCARNVKVSKSIIENGRA